MRAPPAIDQAIAARILSCPGLPTLPAVAIRVLELCAEDEVDLAAVAAAVSHDPAIVAKLLRLANSASFATRGKVGSLARAVALLGFNATLAVTLSFSLVGGRRSNDASGFDHPGFWRRAVFSAIAGRALGTSADHDEADAFVACLLQDLGMLALNEVFPGEYGQVCLAAEAQHEALTGMEIEVLRVDHVQVGCLMARRWNLPERLEEAISHSHDAPDLPPGSGGLALPHVVFLSGRLADAWTSTRPAMDTRSMLGAAADRLRLSPEVIPAALQRMAAAVPEASDDFDLDLGGPDRVEAVLEEAQRLLAIYRPPGAARDSGAIPEPSAELFRACAEGEVARALRGGQPVALLAIRTAEAQAEDQDQADLDVTRLLRESLRQTDLLARESGHFLAILVDTPARGALVVAERMRTRLAAAGRRGAFGLACLPDSGLGSFDQLRARALDALEAGLSKGSS
jgi:HD-like signal output (HDOD) protein